MTPTEIQLPKIAQTRITRLAHASGRSPAAMLRFVLRDGFEAVELSIKENTLADAQFAAGATMSHADVMRDALSTVHQAKHENIISKDPAHEWSQDCLAMAGRFPNFPLCRSSACF